MRRRTKQRGLPSNLSEETQILECTAPASLLILRCRRRGKLGKGGGGKGDQEQGRKDWDEMNREAGSDEGHLKTLDLAPEETLASP